MIVLDASVLIAHLDGTDRRHARATELLVTTAGAPLRVSPLTLAEVLVGPAKAGQLDRAAAVVDDLGIVVVPLALDAPVRLAELRAATGLRLPGCCVLLAALTAGADLATFDDKLAEVAIQHNLMVHTRNS